MITQKLIKKGFFITLSAFVLASILSGCGAKEPTSLEKIYSEQQSTQNISKQKELKSKISEKLMDNIKKNSSNAIDNAMNSAEKSKAQQEEQLAQGNTEMSFEERADAAAAKLTAMSWGTIMSGLVSLQSSSIPISICMILFGSLLAAIFRKDRPKMKFFMFIAIGGPVIFLIIAYVPAFMWYLMGG